MNKDHLYIAACLIAGVLVGIALAGNHDGTSASTAAATGSDAGVITS